MLSFRLENKLMQKQDIIISTEIPLTNLYETKVPETKSENWDILITEDHVQEGQENLDFLLAKLEKENKRLINDPKRVSSRFLTNRSRQHFRDIINSRINNPITSSFLIDEITSIDNISDIDFWIELISDYNATAVRSPYFLTKKIREGIPHPLRGLVWQSMSGAQDTNLEGLFETLRNEQSPYEKIIIRDLSRTFPGVEMFKEEGGDGQKKLQSVLRAFSLYDAEVGYCQGLGFIVGPLLMNMFEHEAFCVLVRLMECYDMRTMFTINLSGLHLRLFQFEHFLSLRIPSISIYFNSIGIHSLMYASQWFLSLFAVTCPLSTLHRIYDIIFGEGAPETIIKIAIALIIKNKERLLNLDFEENLQFLLSPELWAVYNQNNDELISDALELDNIVTRNSLIELEQKFNQNISENHKTFSKSTTSEIQAVAIKFFEKLRGSTNAYLPIFINSSTNPDSFYEHNNIQGISSELNISTFSSTDTELSESKRITNSTPSPVISIDRRASSGKTSAFSNSFERNNKELHYQIEDLVVAFSSLQKEHTSVTEELETLRRISLKYRNIALKLIELINEFLNPPNKEISVLKESKKLNINEKVDAITLGNRVFSENHYKDNDYDKSEIVQKLIEELNDSSLPPNPLEKELSSLQEKLLQEQLKVKNLEKQIDMRDQIHDVRIHWNEMLKEKQKIQRVVSETKYRQSSYINNIQKDSPKSYNNTNKGLRELKLLQQDHYGSTPESTNISPKLQQTCSFLGMLTPSSSSSISENNHITHNICISCEQLREELSICRSKLQMYNRKSEESQKPKYFKKAIFNGQCLGSQNIDLSIVSSTLEISTDDVLNAKNRLFSGKWGKFKWG
ncbi:hypothetical protein PCK1_001808 [Pneumocystis canis]|nr:hypothetical protein PCK1_001808 [Pneumocystis canis]